MNNETTAGIIVIGNEILSGKVHDTNSYYLATELRALGVDVRRISVIPDNVKEIGREAVKFSGMYDYIFTTGGVGPTHDDITIAGIADGFRVKVIRHPQMESFLTLKYGGPANDAVLKMAEVPEGAEIISKDGMRFPIILFKNIFIFPGIPEYLRNKFVFIKDRLRGQGFYLRRIFLNAHESDVSGVLNRIVKQNADVIIGSYPAIGKPDYRVMITVESRSESAVIKAVDALTAKLPANIIVRLE